ncbi:sulfite exporter TauE/SafE family protein [Mesorhizobium sp. ANAO-SY3R2]|uniref:sulfite exporter TauE/SafE family protein n=1 Tax=Mesorhizobium sp. ANAO-SY3R2 TaxID=3166644 RepID=UPI003671749C
MSLISVAILFLSGFFSGVVNAIAGGGTFLTFGALTMTGLPPISANATSSIAQFPGYITSTYAYLHDIKAMWRGALAFAVISAIGALLGSLLLLSLDNVSFGALVPWLLLAATALFAAGPWLRPKKLAERPEGATSSLAGRIIQFFTSIYGGFFGAGMGVMMLATLGLTEGGDYHRLNALKNLLSIVIAAVAIVIFASGGVVAWMQAAIMVPGVALGGYAGVWTARRVPQGVVRALVVAVGLFLALHYFTKG